MHTVFVILSYIKRYSHSLNYTVFGKLVNIPLSEEEKVENYLFFRENKKAQLNCAIKTLQNRIKLITIARIRAFKRQNHQFFYVNCQKLKKLRLIDSGFSLFCD